MVNEDQNTHAHTRAVSGQGQEPTRLPWVKRNPRKAMFVPNNIIRSKGWDKPSGQTSSSELPVAHATAIGLPPSVQFHEPVRVGLTKGVTTQV